MYVCACVYMHICMAIARIVDKESSPLKALVTDILEVLKTRYDKHETF